MALVVLVVGCGGGSGVEGASTTVATFSTTTTTTAPPPITTTVAGLQGFASVDVRVGGVVWTVALADNPMLRSVGLMGVTDLGGLDGMLFTFEADTVVGFNMRGTVIPLNIAFFSGEGALVDRLEMIPCPDAVCPSYRASAPYRFALETPAGGFDRIASLSFDVAAFSG